MCLRSGSGVHPPRVRWRGQPSPPAAPRSSSARPKNGTWPAFLNAAGRCVPADQIGSGGPSRAAAARSSPRGGCRAGLEAADGAMLPLVAALNNGTDGPTSVGNASILMTGREGDEAAELLLVPPRLGSAAEATEPSYRR